MKYFTQKEFWCKCAQCQKGDAELGIPPGGMMGGVAENVKALVENVLDPAREWFGGPIRVNSGYRCPKHNLAVGGVRGSQHLRGEAADVMCADVRLLKQIIVENGRYDQLIDYGTFVHVSWKRNGGNRKQILCKV